MVTTRPRRPRIRPIDILIARLTDLGVSWPEGQPTGHYRYFGERWIAWEHLHGPTRLGDRWVPTLYRGTLAQQVQLRGTVRQLAASPELHLSTFLDDDEELGAFAPEWVDARMVLVVWDAAQRRAYLAYLYEQQREADELSRLYGLSIGALRHP